MKILLHTCCAPCLIYPCERLKAQGFEVAGYFYNPNVHPFSEYKNRKQAVELLGKELDLEIVFPQYKPEDFFHTVNMKEAKQQRCSLCWSFRLKETARAAKQRGYNSFSTTLLVSPYQDQERLKQIGEDIARQESIDFYYEDFRTGFKYAHEKARAQGLYCQKYCGCIFSEIERYKK